MTYKALVVEEIDKKFIKSLKELPLEDLDKNDILIKVSYSALNYKDALSANGNKGVTRNYPHTPGIDAAGVVKRSNSKDFKEGDKVIVTSYDLGMNTPGSFSEYISVPKEWVIPLPKNLSQKEAIAIGTAGLTSAIGVEKLIKNSLQPIEKILVTGASGGVGSFSVKLLSHLGFEVTAFSRSKDNYEFLKTIGATEVISEIETDENKPLLKPKFDAVFDVVGGKIAQELLKQIKKEGSMAICGLVDSYRLDTTVFPFILRGINLLGVDSAQYPYKNRVELWQKLANEWKMDISDLIDEKSFDLLPRLLDDMLKGETRGRVIIKI